MSKKALAILLTFVGGLIGCHGLVGYSLVRFFAVVQPQAQVVVFSALMVLAVSFPLAMVLAWLHSNPATRVLYFVAAFWIGCFIYPLLGTVLAWVVFGASTLFGVPVDMRWVYGALLGMALAVALLGLFNAMRIQITRIDVRMRNLPPAWEGKTLAHLSDLHVGPIRRAGFLRQVARKVDSLDPTVVLITGDLFDGACRKPSAFAAPLDELRAERGVFFVTGNHEHYLGIERALAALRRTKIRVLDDETVEVDGLQIVGVGYRAYRRGNPGRDAFRDGTPCDPNKPTVLLYHTPTSIDVAHTDLGRQQLSTYFAPDTDFGAQRRKGVDLQLSGHTHAGQIAPFGWLTRRLFNGYDRGLHELADFTLYTSSGTGTWGPPIRTVGKCEIVAIRLMAREA